MTPRALAAKTLVRIVKDNAYSNIELSNILSQSGLNSSDNALYQAIVKTSLERKNTLDFIINLFVKSKPDILSRCLLYTGISQLLYMDKIPDSAACDETVKAAKSLAGQGRAGFINGVLRNIARERAKIEESLKTADESVKYSMDKSVIDLIYGQYGKEAGEIFTSSFTKPPMGIRVNTLKTDIDFIKKLFDQNGIKYGISTEGFLFVTEGQGKAVELTETGLFYIQGTPSQQAVKMLKAKPGMTVIDVCACPGGKTLGAAIDMENKGKIVSLDIHSNKLPLITKLAEKLGINIIETQTHNSQNTLPDLIETADVVICDVPCSSLGVMASKPEIRYKDVSDLSDLYKIQAEILNASSEYVKPGGALVYSTCTINREENQNQIETFLKNHSYFTLEEQKLWTTNNGCFEGFFAARLVKRNV
jgi:16S rRNA (cytosine967-C5)-methyltransferase